MSEGRVDVIEVKLSLGTERIFGISYKIVFTFPCLKGIPLIGFFCTHVSSFDRPYWSSASQEAVY